MHIKTILLYILKHLEKSGQSIADAEDRMVASMFKEEGRDDSKEK